MENEASRVSLTTSWPQTRRYPSVGRNRPVSILIAVVLPAPLGPKSENNSPVGHRQVNRSTATLRVYRRVTLSNSIIVSSLRLVSQTPPLRSRPLHQFLGLVVGHADEQQRGVEKHDFLLQHHAVGPDPNLAPAPEARRPWRCRRHRGRRRTRRPPWSRSRYRAPCRSTVARMISNGLSGMKGL